MVDVQILLKIVRLRRCKMIMNNIIIKNEHASTFRIRFFHFPSKLLAVIAPPKVVRTAHPGCTCVSESTNLKTGETTSIGKKMGYWRDFFTKKYETYVGKKDFLRDPPTGAEAWVKKLPLKDRFAALFAGQYQPGDKPPAPTRLPSAGEQICRTIPGMTNGFAVCPVEMSCLDGKGQESDRFLGRNRWTWDYCAMDGWGGHQWGLPQPDVAIAPTGM